MANPLPGLQQRSAAETLEYLGWAATQLVKFSDIPAHAHIAVTAQALVDAGVQVWRHESGTGHSYVYWPGKMASPVQCFNPRQAASAIMKQAGWKEALGLDKLPPPPPEEPVDAGAADTDATATDPPATIDAAAGSGAAAAGDNVAAGTAPAPAATPAAADAPAADVANAAGPPAADTPASPTAAAAAGSEQQPQEDAGTTPSAAAAAAAAGSPSSGGAASAVPAAVKSEGDAMDVDAAGDTGDEVDAAAAAGIDNTGCFPGYTFLRPEKEQQVLDGVADKLTVMARRKFTGAEIRGLGLRAVAEMKRQRRQYSIWWPGKFADTEEPVHCAPSYTVGAQRLLQHAACREALGVTSLPPLGAAGPSSSSDAAGLAGPLSGTKRPAGDTSAAGDAAAGSGPSYPKRTRAADASEAAVAAEDDVKQPLAALAAAAGLALAPGRRASAIAAAAAAKKHHGPVPGSEILQAVKQYTGSTKEVQGKVKAALQQLTDALKIAGDAKTWSPDSIKALPGGAVLAAGLDTRSLTAFLSEAQEMHDSLAADAAQLDTLLAQNASGSRTAAGSSSGGGGRTRGSGTAAAEAAYRKPIVAFRSALEACAADVTAWLRQQRQQDVLQRLQAVKELKALVENNRELQQQLAQVKRQLQEQQQQQRRGSSVDDGDRNRQGDARRAAEERRQQQQQEQQRQQLMVLLEQQKQQKQQQMAMRRQQQQQQQKDPKQQREQEEEEAEDEALLLAPQQQIKLQPLQPRYGDVPSASKGHAKPAQVRAAAEALMAAARAKAAAVQDALLGTGAGNDRAQNGAGAGKAAAAAAAAAADEEDDVAASSEPAAAAPASAPAVVPPASAPAIATAAEQQQEKVPAFPQNAPGSVLQFLQHLMKTGSSRPAANGAAAARQEADDMDDDF